MTYKRVEQIATVILMILLMIVSFYAGRKSVSPKIVEVPSVSTENLKKALPEASGSDVKKIEKEIKTAVPAYEYFTSDNKEADTIASDLAKDQKADKVIKDSYKLSAPNNKFDLYENKYYAINLDKKHDIKIGAAYIYNGAYGSVSYRNRDIEYTAYYGGKNKSGIGISYTIAKW